MNTLLSVPSPGGVTRGFSAIHLAIDYGHGAGAQVRAAAAGTVAIDHTPGYGNRVSIDHGALIGPKAITRYAHLASIAVPAGKRVAQGDPIGVEGESGSFARGVHLHFELLLAKGTGLVRVDPTIYLAMQAPIERENMNAVIFQAKLPNAGEWVFVATSEAAYQFSVDGKQDNLEIAFWAYTLGLSPTNAPYAPTVKFGDDGPQATYTRKLLNAVSGMPLDYPIAPGRPWMRSEHLAVPEVDYDTLIGRLIAHLPTFTVKAS